MIDRPIAAVLAAIATLVATALLIPVAGASAQGSAVLVLLQQERGAVPDYDQGITDGMAALPQLSIGLSSATQGSYVREQALLDISQGTRVSRSTYSPEAVPPAGPPLVDFAPPPGPIQTPRVFAPPGLLGNWKAILNRAKTAPQTIDPGLLAASIPSGAAFAGGVADGAEEAIPAADRKGRVAAVSLLNSARRVEKLSKFYGLTVVHAPPGRRGLAELRQILALRGPDQLVIATQSPPDASILPLLPIGVAGLQGPPGGLTSDTTNLPNLVAGIDIAPTVLDHLGLDIPDDMRGRVMRSDGERDPAALAPFRNRLEQIGPRRYPALALLGAAWLALFLGWGAIAGVRRARLPVRRIGGLAILWLPTVILIPAAIGNPSARVEYAIVVFGCLGLGWLSDRLMPWPRAPLIPAIVGLGAITIDLILGSHLIIRSLLGPNPGSGSRFYGVGNELKSGLTVLLLAGLAAAMTGRPKSRGAAVTVLAAGLMLGVVLGSGRLGAGVGAVIIVAGASAVAAMMMLPGRMTGPRIAVLILSPIVGLVLLAMLDALTAGGQGHLSNSVLTVDSFSSFAQTVERRSTLAWQQLWRAGIPAVTLLCVLAAAFAIRNRSVFRPYAGPIWPAALIGGLTGGVIGSLTEDSGPMLIIVATITLTGVCSYLLGRPEAGEVEPPTEAQLPSAG